MRTGWPAGVRPLQGERDGSLVQGGGVSDVALVIWRHIAWARRLSRLVIGCAEQRLVGGAEVGCGQATWVQLPDLFGYGDGDLDVLAAAGGVEALGVRAELGLGVQRFVADREQGRGGDPVAESVRGHGRRLHVHGEGARLTETIFG